MPKSLSTLKHYMVGLLLPGSQTPIQEPIWAPTEKAAKDAALEKHPGANASYVLKYFRVELMEADTKEPIYFDCQADDAEHAKDQAQNAYPGCHLMGLVDEALFVIWAPSEESEEDQCEDGFFNEKDGWGHFDTAALYSGFERDAGMLLMSSGSDHRFVPYEEARHMVKGPACRTKPVVRLRVVLDIAYEPEGMQPDELQVLLTRNLEHAVGNGLLSGDSPALVDEWLMKVGPVSEEAASLDQEEVADWMADQVESGSINPEQIPELLARYALTDANEMREELAERMGK